MEFAKLVLFDDKPNFFNTNSPEHLLSPVFELRAGGGRAANSHFWAAMGDIYCDPAEPAQGVIEWHGITDKVQQNELRYCGAHIMLRQKVPFEKAINHHGIGDGLMRDILWSEAVALKDLKEKSSGFRNAFAGVYYGDNVFDVIKDHHITDELQKAFLKDHAFMFYIRREVKACDLSKFYEVDDVVKSSLFREGCRQQIERGMSAPEAIRHQGMENEADKALMRMIGASEDIQEGMSVADAAQRNEVPAHHVGRLDEFKNELEVMRDDRHFLDGLPEDLPRALETMIPDSPHRRVKRKRGSDESEYPPLPPAKRVCTKTSNSITRLNGGKQPVPNAYVLNAQDRLVLEESFKSAGVKAARDTSSSPLTNFGTEKNPVDLARIDVPPSDNAGRRHGPGGQLDERARAPTGGRTPG